MEGDWLKLHRKILDSRIFSDAELLKLWIWCLAKANWKTGYFQGRMIPRGSFATGQEVASKELGIHKSKFRRMVKKLESWKKISTISTNRFTIVTIVNYEQYQTGTAETDTPATHQRHTSDTPPTTIEEGKKERKKEPPPNPLQNGELDTDQWLVVEELLSSGMMVTVARNIVSELKIGREQAIQAVATYQANQNLLDSPGAISHFFRNGNWPVEGVKSPELRQSEAETKKRARKRDEVERRQYLFCKAFIQKHKRQPTQAEIDEFCK
jgi:hypothetical protein